MDRGAADALKRPFEERRRGSRKAHRIAILEDLKMGDGGYVIPDHVFRDAVEAFRERGFWEEVERGTE